MAAAKQSRRVRFPIVADLATTDEVVDLVRAAALAALLDETATRPIAELALPGGGEVVVIVGPEGGFTDEERARLVEAGASPVRLGPSVLRTSSAGMAAVSVLMAPSSRWLPASLPGMEG